MLGARGGGGVGDVEVGGRGGFEGEADVFAAAWDGGPVNQGVFGGGGRGLVSIVGLLTFRGRRCGHGGGLTEKYRWEG